MLRSKALPVLTLLFVLTLLVPAPATRAQEQVTISFATNVVGVQAELLQTIVNEFMDENPDIKVEFSAPGQEYENQMRVMMAANDLPDVFSTHGWAKIRYGEFLLDLSGEEWVSRIAPPMAPIVTDEAGKVYVLPLDQDMAMPVFNADILEEYAIEVPTTWDELLAACDTLVEQSGGDIIPIHVGGGDGWPIGHMVDLLSNPLLTTAEENYGAALIDGSFDWDNFNPMGEFLLELQDHECFNVDVITAKYSDSATAFAEGRVAFGFYGPFLIEEARKTNPDLKAGLMPVPAAVEGDTPSFSGGEKTTLGIWKDSDHIEEARLLLNYFAQAENVARVAESNKLPAGLTDVEVDLGDLGPYFAMYADTRIFPYFDRVYLPNGMWEPLYSGAQELLSGASSPEDYSELLSDEYQRLLGG
jgi:raffinose/stachyose/melibiose transport system substrate-binding protein